MIDNIIITPKWSLAERFPYSPEPPVLCLNSVLAGAKKLAIFKQRSILNLADMLCVVEWQGCYVVVRFPNQGEIVGDDNPGRSERDV